MLTSSNCTTITIDSDYINLFQATPGDYDKLTVSGTFNNGSTFSYEFTAAIPSNGVEISSTAGVETIHPAFFEQDTLLDGVYKVTVALQDTDGLVTQEQACIFKDCSGLNCDVATKDAMYYYYVLTNNCSCNCAKLYTIYEALLAEMEKTTQDESDCGCV